MIAEDHLTPTAKANIHDLLGKDINISDFGIANWADEVRRDRPETGPWHYVDIPTDAKAYDQKRDGQNGNNVIDKVTDFESVLKDPKASRNNRVEALKFLVHFVGDLHQPLHCAERDKDRGGNNYQVYFLNREFPINLHSVWDGAILLTRRDTMQDSDYAAKLNASITPDQIKQWSKGTPTDWANESHDVAVNSAYKDLPAVGPYPKLDQKYFDNNGPVVDQQLERAGVRLANILNGIFTTMPQPATQPVNPDQPHAVNPHTNQPALQRFADDRLGIMFHWGPAVLRNAEISWSMSNRATYESVYKDFNPKHFDADQWASVGKMAGAKYMVYVCKHHDGFCMWDTKTTDNNIMNTPFKRDVVAELSRASERHGLMFGTYLSIMDIHEDNWNRCYAARTPMPGYPQGIPHITDFTAAQTAELLSKYNSQMMWYDGGWLQGWRTSDAPAKVEAVVRSINPKALITRLGNDVDDYECMEARIGTYRSVPWEMVTSVAYPTYSYNTNIKYKPASFFIQTLSRVVCGNGNLLLNFVPDVDGAIPPEQQQIATEMGAWLKTNGQAVFGTRGGPYYPNTWGGSTHKDKTIYLFLLPEAPDTLHLPPCGAKVVDSKLITGGSVTVSQNDTGIDLTIPQASRDPTTTVVELTMDAEVTEMVQASRPKAPLKIKQNGGPAPIEERTAPTTGPTTAQTAAPAK